jgi:hypothetical protein
MQAWRAAWRRLVGGARPPRPPRGLSSQELREAAQRASSWMAPWERAQMDAPHRPLSTAEKVYFNLLAVFGPVGLVYELYVCDNKGSIFRQPQPPPAGGDGGGTQQEDGAQHAFLIRGNHGCRSHVFVDDAQLSFAPAAGQEPPPVPMAPS